MVNFEERSRFLSLLGTSHERFRHTLDGEYKYTWRHSPDTEIEANEIRELRNRNEQLVVEFTNTNVRLYPGYSWNGSNIVGDTERTLRASALHDAWCQAMDGDNQFYKGTRRNWMKGADEYRDICKVDGFGTIRTYVRWLAIRAHGVVKSFS